MAPRVLLAWLALAPGLAANPVVDRAAEEYSRLMWLPFILALPAEALLLGLLGRSRGVRWWRFALVWLFVTSATAAGLHFGLTALEPEPSLGLFVLGEIAVVLLEAFCLLAVLRWPWIHDRKGVSPRVSLLEALGASFLVNLCSFVIGWVASILFVEILVRTP